LLKYSGQPKERLRVFARSILNGYTRTLEALVKNSRGEARIEAIERTRNLYENWYFPLYPDDLDCWAGYGDFLLHTATFDEAKKFLEEGLKKAGGDAEKSAPIHHVLGRLY